MSDDAPDKFELWYYNCQTLEFEEFGDYTKQDLRTAFEAGQSNNKALQEILKPISAEWKRIENNNTLWHLVPNSVKNAIRETLELTRKEGVDG